MKTIRIFFTVLLICSLADHQLFSQDWHTSGNTVFPGNFIGSTNNQDLRFRVNNYPRMRIMSNSGFVGLGANGFNPAAFLHINQPTQHNASGNLIRTDGNDILDLNWSMYSGSSGNLTRKAQFLLSPNTLTQGTGDPWESNMTNDAENHLRIESILGDIVFRAHGANSTEGGSGTLSERMRITSALHTDPHWGDDPESTTRVSILSSSGEIVTQNEEISDLESQLETQATQLEEMQNQIADMAHAVQAMQAKTANCCDCPTKGESGTKPSGSADEIKLGQNIPNPFDQQTRIEFSIPAPASVILEITDASGRPLERLIDAPMTKGNHSAVWDGSDYAPGLYFYSLYADGQLLTRKMIKQR